MYSRSISAYCEHEMLDDAPFFSVIIPTHNRAEYLKQAINSVIKQTFVDFELLIVDDQSFDQTKAVVRSFDDPRIVYLENDHMPGGAGARNSGIFRSRGEWIAFLDDDDVWLPEKLERQYVRAQEAAEEVALIYTGVQKCSPDLMKILLTIRPSKEGYVLNELLYRNFIGTYSSVAIRSSILRSIGGLDDAFPAMQDSELYIRVAMVAKIACIEEPLVLYRTNTSGNISRNMNAKLKAAILIRQKYWHLIKHNLRQRHRAASRIFIFALQSNNWPIVLRVLPGIMIGVFCDPSNILLIIKLLWSSIMSKRELSGGFKE